MLGSCCRARRASSLRHSAARTHLDCRLGERVQLFLSREHNTEQSLTFKNAMIFCHHYENLSLLCLIFWCIENVNQPTEGIVPLLIQKCQPHGLGTSCHSASFQMGKKRIIKFLFLCCHCCAGLPSGSRPRADVAGWLSSCAPSTPAGWRLQPRARSRPAASGTGGSALREGPAEGSPHASQVLPCSVREASLPHLGPRWEGLSPGQPVSSTSWSSTCGCCLAAGGTDCSAALTLPCGPRSSAESC